MNTAQIKSGKKPWSPEEDTLLMELIELHGIIGNWCATTWNSATAPEIFFFFFFFLNMHTLNLR